MNNRDTLKKIILIFTIFFFMVSFLQPLIEVEAATSQNLSNLWSNPNQFSSKDSFKITTAKVLKSGLLQSVIGCTGVVDSISGWMSKFIKNKATIAKELKDKVDKYRALLKSQCSSTKAGLEGAAGVAPMVNDLVTPVDTMLGKIKVNVQGHNTAICQQTVDATSDEQLAADIKRNEEADKQTFKLNCLDGIAVTLAKNQLTAITHNSINWINSGYGGNPFFVKNLTSLTNSIEKNVLDVGINQLTKTDNAYPYGAAFSRAAINSYKSGATKYGATNFLDSLTSDLGAFITDPTSYVDTQGTFLDTQTTPLERSKAATKAFSNDFASGGWSGWLALTQKPQNNPLGFTMLASQYLADQQARQINEKKDELVTNNGFMSQKVCIMWQNFDKNTGKPLKEMNKNYDTGSDSTQDQFTFVYSPTRKSDYDVCKEPDGWKTITPGSIIKDKVTNYLDSPVRQLELARTINDSMNALFSVLISKLEQGGLSGLSDKYVAVDWTDTTNSGFTTDANGGSAPYDNNGAYDTVDLTKDLGNTFIHDATYSLGTWNAKANITNTKITLYPNLAPIKEGPHTVNVYYTVTQPAKTELVIDGYNGWEVGDRAFWDGSAWQNWKKDQTNPIKKRGILQIQQDYILAAKNILAVFPAVMPTLGELDYCLPGPNPSYKTNSESAQSAYSDWVGTMFVGPTDSSGERYGWYMDAAGSRTYTNLANIFSDNPNVWNDLNIPGTWLYQTFANGGYHYGKNGNLGKGEQADLDKHQWWVDNYNEYVNEHFFNRFYELFDKMMNKFYFNGLTSQYLLHEYDTETDPKPNPAYVPMATEGYNLTSRIVDYNDEVTVRTKEYQDAIAQTQVNIGKLKPILAEVSKIVKDAQDRRNILLLAQLNKLNANPVFQAAMAECEVVRNDCSDGFASGRPHVPGRSDYDVCNDEYNACMADKNVTQKPQMSQAEFNKFYAECFNEEAVQYYDDTYIVGASKEEGRCSDKIDNDRDGLIDEKDPDCAGSTAVTPPANEVGYCGIKSEYSGRNEPNNAILNGQCANMLTENDCNNTTVYGEEVTQETYQSGNNVYNMNYNIQECQWVK